MPDNIGRKGVITFIVKVITPGMRWCLNINVLPEGFQHSLGSFIVAKKPLLSLPTGWLKDRAASLAAALSTKPCRPRTERGHRAGSQFVARRYYWEKVNKQSTTTTATPTKKASLRPSSTNNVTLPSVLAGNCFATRATMNQNESVHATAWPDAVAVAEL